MVGGSGGRWLRPILVFSLSLDQAEQLCVQETPVLPGQKAPDTCHLEKRGAPRVSTAFSFVFVYCGHWCCLLFSKEYLIPVCSFLQQLCNSSGVVLKTNQRY